MNSKFIDDPLNHLIQTIPTIVVPENASLELELRFNIDSRKTEKQKINKLSPSDATKLAKNIITDYINKKASCSIEQSINFIKDDKFIKQIIFINGIQQKNLITHYKKEKIIHPLIVIDIPSYKITLSFEHKIEEFSIQDCKNARIRLRFSIIMEPFRLDITLVRLVELNNPATLKDDKTKMLFELPIKDFVDKAPWNFVNHIEFEAEYIGFTGEADVFERLSVADINAVSRFMHEYVENIHMIDGIDNLNSNFSSINDEANKSVIQSEYQNKIYEVAKYIDPRQLHKYKNQYGLKQLSNQVLELDKNTFLTAVYPTITNFYITDKTDGKRAVIFINENGAYAITNDLKKFDDPSNITTTYVFDAEEYKDGYYIFDVMVWEGKSITNMIFEKRMGKFKEAIDIASNITDLKIKEKPFIKLTADFQLQIKQFKEEKKPYETDGIILTPYDGLYNTMTVYKYKPINKMSIDFLIKECPKKLLGIKPYISNGKKLYLLFCGIAKNVKFNLDMALINHYEEIFPNIHTRHLPQYFPIQFEPSDNKYSYLFWADDTIEDYENLDGKIGEFIVSNPNDTIDQYRWKLLHIRKDRQIELERGNYFGNNYKVAEITWMNYQNPLVIEAMNFDSNDAYFQVSNSELHKASRNFNSYVKTQIFEQFKETASVFDLASGKGQDLFRYASCHIKKILFSDVDKTALTELIHRKHDFSKNKENNSMQIMIQCLDLNEAFKNNIEKIENNLTDIPVTGFDLIVCNFAFHYFLSSSKSLTNVIKFINRSLKVGGRFIMTSFDGADVLELLKNTPKGEWSSKTPNKFSIKKRFNDATMNTTGQQIDVLLPFSQNKYYPEYLVNIEAIEEEFEKYNITLETNQSFAEYLDNYQKTNSNGYKMMDEDDKTYVGLYHYYGFFKNKK